MSELRTVSRVTAVCQKPREFFLLVSRTHATQLTAKRSNLPQVSRMMSKVGRLEQSWFALYYNSTVPFLSTKMM